MSSGSIASNLQTNNASSDNKLSAANEIVSVAEGLDPLLNISF